MQVEIRNLPTHRRQVGTLENIVGVKPGKIRNFQKWKNDNNNNKLLEWFREA